MRLLKSRTIITLFILASLGAFQAVEPFMDSEIYLLVNTALITLAGFFRIDARVNFKE